MKLVALDRPKFVHLVEHRDGGGTRRRRQFGRLLEGRGHSFGGVGEIDDHVGVGERPERRTSHGSVELVSGVEQPGRVEHDHLRVGGRADSNDAVARGLGLRAHDGQLLTDDAIEERGLSGVGFADDGDDTSA